MRIEKWNADFRKNERGFSLIGTLPLAGIGLAILAGILPLIVAQSRELQGLKTKIVADEVKAEVQELLKDNLSCLATFGPPFSIDDTQVGASGYKIPLTKLTESGMPSQDFIRVNDPIAAMPSHVIVSRIEAGNFQRVAAEQYKFDITIQYTSEIFGSPGVTKVVGLEMVTDPVSPASAKVPISCRFPPPAAPLCRHVSSISAGTEAAYAFCDSDEQPISGSGDCTTLAGNTFVWPDPYNDHAYLIVNGPYTSNSGQQGWQADCFGPLDDTANRVRASAYCCKK